MRYLFIAVTVVFFCGIEFSGTPGIQAPGLPTQITDAEFFEVNMGAPALEPECPFPE